MTDLEITRLCAEAMGLPEWPDGGYDCRPISGDHRDYWQPLHDDAQAMALVKKFLPLCLDALNDARWAAFNAQEPMEDINKIICECVAKMQAQK